MKKRVILGMLFLLIASPSVSFGETTINNDSSSITENTKVAVVGSIILGVGKNLLYQMGSQVLQKYATPGIPSIFPTYIPPVTTTPVPATTTVTNPAAPGAMTVPAITPAPVSNMPQEQLIPIK